MALKTIRLTWTQTAPIPNDMDHFNIGRDETGDPMFPTIATIPYPGEQAEYTYEDEYDVPANQTKTLRYKVFAVDTDGNSSESNIGSITIEMQPPPAPVLTVEEV